MRSINRAVQSRFSKWFFCSVPAAAAIAGASMLLVPQAPAQTTAPQTKQGAAPTPPKPFLSFTSAGVESFLRSPKDAWILDAVRRMESNGIQLPPELRRNFESDPKAAVAAAIIRDLLTTRIAGSVALQAPQGGGPPMPEGQFSFMGNARRSGRSLEPSMIDAMRLSGAWSGFTPDSARPGFRTFAPDEGPRIWFGTLDMAGGSATVLSVGRPPSGDAPDLARFGIAKGVEPQFTFEIDFEPLQPFLGMASVMLPPGPDGKSPLEQSGLISKTPMILRAVATNDGTDGRIDARLVNGAKALAFDDAMRAMTIAPADLQWIPADARTAIVGKADWRKTLNTLIDQYNAQAAIFGDGEEDFEDGMSGEGKSADNDGAAGGSNEGVADRWVKDNLGLDLRRDVIAPLGDLVVIQSPASLGGGLFGSAAIVTLRDSKTMTATLDRLSKLMSREPEMSKNGIGMRARSHPGCDALYSLSVAGIPLPIQLTIGIGNGALAMGLSPQAVISALAQAKAKSSIVDHAGFKMIGGAALVKDAHSIGWFDATATMRDGYGALLGLATALDNAMLPQDGATTALSTLVPTVDQLAAGAKPSILVGRVDGDDLAWTYRCDGSFSVQTAAFLSQVTSGSTSMSAMAAGVMLPALTKARVAAREVKSMTQLKMIGMGLMTFAADHKDALPESLDEIVAAGILPEIPTSARSGQGRTGRFEYRRPAKSLAAIQFPDRTILAWEQFTFFPSDGVAVLFADGHVEQIETEEAFRAVRDR